MVKSLCESVQNKSALCSPVTGTFVFDYEKINEKIVECGREFDEYFPPNGESSKVLPIFCDNRICNNDGCKEHRQYKFMRHHREQIKILNRNMRKPKAWIFTGWVLPFETISRRFVQKKLVFLFWLLKNFASSEFSVHMEFKVYPAGHKNYGCFYIHFHVVCGGFRDLRFLRKRWGRHISFEEAIMLKELGFYVSKYASKTPTFPDDETRYYYGSLVYKLQMHRFSSGRAVYEASGWLSLSSIEREVFFSLYRDSYKVPYSRKKRYHPFLEGKPPPQPRKTKNRGDEMLERLLMACEEQSRRYNEG